MSSILRVIGEGNDAHDGFASVISAVLATLLAIAFGFSAVLVFALALYAGAALLIPKEAHR